jgi:hypothetical protein
MADPDLAGSTEPFRPWVSNLFQGIDRFENLLFSASQGCLSPDSYFNSPLSGYISGWQSNDLSHSEQQT